MTIDYIALCGAPEVGKSEVQQLLDVHFGFKPIDDSWILRDATQLLYGLEEWHVTTQEGKATLIDVGGQKVTVRKLMGELGVHLEKRDPHHIPKRALAHARSLYPNTKLSFGSVRLDQAKVFKDTQKALVIEIKRPGFAPINDFDHYDATLADISITNPYKDEDPIATAPLLLEELKEKIAPYL